MIYFHETKGDIKYYNMIQAIDDRVDIDMQKSSYLKAYKEQTICEVCVYDFEIEGIYRNTWCIFMELRAKLIMMTLLRHLKIKLSNCKIIYVLKK